MRRINERGAGMVTFVVGAGVLVVIGVVVLYMASDVFKTKADSAYRQFSEWTPENIAEDPLGYLDFCEAEAKRAVRKLKATRIEIAANRVSLKDSASEAAKLVRVGEKNIRELLVKHDIAEEGGGWPIEWQGAERDRKYVEAQLAALDRQIRGQEEIVKAAGNGLRSLDEQSTRVDELNAMAREQLSTIQVKRQMLKVQQISDTLREQLVRIGTVVRTTVAAADESASEPISLEELAAKEEPAVDPGAMDRIRSRYGSK